MRFIYSFHPIKKTNTDTNKRYLTFPSEKSSKSVDVIYLIKSPSQAVDKKRHISTKSDVLDIKNLSNFTFLYTKTYNTTNINNTLLFYQKIDFYYKNKTIYNKPQNNRIIIRKPPEPSVINNNREAVR